MVTDRIIEKLQSGIIPWHQPWGGVKGNTAGMAINYVTRRAYSMLNQWLLGEPGEYLTFKQIKQLGGSIKKGEKSKFVVFYTRPNTRLKTKRPAKKRLLFIRCFVIIMCGI